MHCIYILLISIYINVFQQYIYVQVKELTLSCKFRSAPACISRLTTSALPSILASCIGVHSHYKNRVRQIQLDQNTFIGKIYIHIHIIYTYHIHTLVCSYPLHSHSHSHLLVYTTATATDYMQTYSTDNNYTHLHTHLLFSSLLLSPTTDYYSLTISSLLYYKLYKYIYIYIYIYTFKQTIHIIYMHLHNHTIHIYTS